MENIGAQGFRWFIARVEDINDPEKTGRVRIRVISLHSENKAQLPTDRLPWARILMHPTSASLNTVGLSPTGIEKGSTVVGFFMDGHECNLPVIMGTLYGNDLPVETIGNDISNRKDNLLPNEPEPSVTRTVYPNNKVLKTKSGHLIEIDDTPNNERINLYHKSGTYVEITSDGRLVIKSVGDVIDLTAKNKFEYIKGDYTLKVDGNISIDGSSVTICQGTQFAARIGDDVDLNTGKIISGSSKVKIG